MSNVRDTEPAPYVIPLSTDGLEVLSFDTTSVGGWAAYFSDRVGPDRFLNVVVRVGPESGEPGKPAWVEEEERSAITFRPEDYANEPFELRELHFASKQGSGGFASSLLREVPIVRIEAAVNQTVHREALLRLILPPNTIEAGTYRGGVSYRLRPLAPVPPAPLDLTIEDPGGYRKPDGFYRQVAERYLWLAAVSPRPAQELADANGLPVGTVHRWVKEAKARRLLLLPAHRGEK